MIPIESNKWPEPPTRIPPPTLTQEQIHDLLEKGRLVVRDAAAQFRGVFHLTEREWNLVLR